MKKMFFLIVMVSYLMYLKGQNCPAIQFDYDNTGNRIQRKQIQITCNNFNNNFRQTAGNNSNEYISVKDTLHAIAYPNPAMDRVIVNVIDNDSKDTDKEIFLIDINGKILYYTKTKEEITEISLSQYNSGTYYIRMVCNKKQKNFQIVKID